MTVGGEAGRGSKLKGEGIIQPHSYDLIITYFSLSDSSLELSGTFASFFFRLLTAFFCFGLILLLVAGTCLCLFLTVVTASEKKSYVIEKRKNGYATYIPLVFGVGLDCF